MIYTVRNKKVWIFNYPGFFVNEFLIHLIKGSFRMPRWLSGNSNSLTLSFRSEKSYIFRHAEQGIRITGHFLQCLNTNSITKYRDGRKFIAKF